MFSFKRKDRTETGHILGRAAKLGPVVAPERKLDRASFAILRLLTHISMYLGADVNVHVSYLLYDIYQYIFFIQPQNIYTETCLKTNLLESNVLLSE